MFIWRQCLIRNGCSYLVRSSMCWMIPGGRVSRVRVLLTAMVILHSAVGLLRIILPISASKGRWPPLCSVTFTPFTHCKIQMSCHIWLLIVFNNGTVIVTHHYGIIVSTSHSENYSGSVIVNPACRHHHLSFIPHPANEISQSGVLCDVIVAGRNWHVDHWASLGKMQLPWMTRKHSISNSGFAVLQWCLWTFYNHLFHFHRY